jgi:hypothetical protein
VRLSTKTGLALTRTARNKCSRASAVVLLLLLRQWQQAPSVTCLCGKAQADSSSSTSCLEKVATQHRCSTAASNAYNGSCSKQLTNPNIRQQSTKPQIGSSNMSQHQQA